MENTTVKNFSCECFKTKLLYKNLINLREKIIPGSALEWCVDRTNSPFVYISYRNHPKMGGQHTLRQSGLFSLNPAGGIPSAWINLAQ